VVDGREAHESARRFFSAIAEANGDLSEPSVGPQLPALFVQTGIDPLSVHVFPVSIAHLGSPAPEFWENRRQNVVEQVDKAPSESIRRLGKDYLKVLDRYAQSASQAGAAFVEIQNAMLFATVGQRAE
jgi:hypothetical protein